MVAKKARKASKKVKNLGAKGLTAKQARNVKGGVIAIITPNPGKITGNITGNTTGAGLLLPAVQKVRG